MRRLIYLLIIALACSGCGAFRKVFKLKESHKVEIVQERKTDSVVIRTDRSTTVVTEHVDTTVTTPAQVVSQDTELNMDSLVNGITAIQNDLIDVRLHLNPITGILSATATIKSQSIPIKFDRVTTKQNNIIEQSRKQEAVLNRSKVEDERRTVDKDPVKFPIWLIIIFIVISVIAASLFWGRKRQ